MPLMVRWPGHIAPGSINTDLVSNLDFAQTFLDLADTDIPSDMQGLSLRPLFSGQTPSNWRKSLFYQYYEFPGPHSVRRHMGVRDARYKLMHFYNLDEWELYDLKQDPREMRSVYGSPEYAAVTERLKGELKRLRRHYRVPDDRGSVSKEGKPRKPLKRKRSKTRKKKKRSAESTGRRAVTGS